MHRDARTELGHPPRKIADRTLAAWAVAAIVVVFAYVAMPVPGVVVMAVWVVAAAIVGAWVGRELSDWWVVQAQLAVDILERELADEQRARENSAAHARRQAEREALERRAIAALLADLRDARPAVVGDPTVSPIRDDEAAS